VKSQRSVETLTTGAPAATGAAFSPRGDVIATSDSAGKIEIWRLRDYKWLYTLTRRQSDARTPSFSPDGRFLAAGWGDGSARVFDLASRKEVATLVHGAPVVAVAFNANGRWIGTAGEDGVVRIWDWRHAHLLATLHEHADLINSLAFSPTDPALVLTASDDRTAKVYRCDTCIPLDRLRRLVAARQAALDAPQRKTG
jgi:WD40 repeat protein